MSIEKSFTVQLSPAANPQDAIDVTFTVIRTLVEPIEGDIDLVIKATDSSALIQYSGSLQGSLSYYVESDYCLGRINMARLVEDNLTRIMEMCIPAEGEA